MTAKDCGCDYLDITGSGQISYTVLQNGGLPRNGAIVVNGQFFNIVQGEAGSLTPPYNLNLSPSTGSGASMSVTARQGTASSNGAHVQKSFLLISNGVVLTNACMLEFDSASGLFRLLSNDGSTWMSAVPGFPTISNSQCTLNLLASAGSTFPGPTSVDTEVTANLTFSSSFAGDKDVLLFASNETFGLSSGWQKLGSWTAPGAAPPAIPDVVSLTPTAGSGQSGTFTAVYRHGGESRLSCTSGTCFSCRRLTSCRSMHRTLA